MVTPITSVIANSQLGGQIEEAKGQPYLLVTKKKLINHVILGKLWYNLRGYLHERRHLCSKENGVKDFIWAADDPQLVQLEFTRGFWLCSGQKLPILHGKEVGPKI